MKKEKCHTWGLLYAFRTLSPSFWASSCPSCVTLSSWGQKHWKDTFSFVSLWQTKQTGMQLSAWLCQKASLVDNSRATLAEAMQTRMFLSFLLSYWGFPSSPVLPGLTCHKPLHLFIISNSFLVLSFLSPLAKVLAYFNSFFKEKQHACPIYCNIPP